MGTMTADTIDGLPFGMVMDLTGLARGMPGSGILAARRQAAPAHHLSGTDSLQQTAPPNARMVAESRTVTEPIPALRSNQQKTAAMETFLADNEDRAFYLAYAALWDREAALDVVQDSMTRLVEYYRDKPADQWPALFRTILKSKINDVRRRRLFEQGKQRLVSLTGLFRSHHDVNGSSAEFEIPEDTRDDGITAPEVECIAAELRNRVAEALQSLSERQRQVFILREWRGMSIKETATTLGCSENSVKQHHFRAMQALREQLAEVWEHARPTTS